MQKQQSAVEQLLDTLKSRLDTINRETTELREQMIQNLLVDTEKYNEIFKEQIMEANRAGTDAILDGGEIGEELYYDQNYNQI